ncbi:MAG: hypothetical protein JSV78_06365, partial [Phycisphaerales bacterium]
KLSPPDYVKEHVFVEEVTVLPLAQPSPLAVVTDQSIGRQLQEHLVLECETSSETYLSGETETWLFYHLGLEKPVEVSLCMDVHIEDGEKEITPAWPMIWRKNETDNEDWHFTLSRETGLTGMKFVLRPNRDLALTTLEIFDMWGTEIRCYLPPLSDEMQRARVEVSGLE